jgi:hypothetical protein
MKVLFILLVLSIAAIMVAAGAMLWRLRWHLRRPHVKSSAVEIPEQEPVEKT